MSNPHWLDVIAGDGTFHEVVGAGAADIASILQMAHKDAGLSEHELLLMIDCAAQVFDGMNGNETCLGAAFYLMRMSVRSGEAERWGKSDEGAD